MISYNGTSPQAPTVAFTAGMPAVYAFRARIEVTEAPPARTVHLKLYLNGGAIPGYPVSEEFPANPAPAVVAADGRGPAARTVEVRMQAGDTLGFSVERYAGSGSTTVPPWYVEFRAERLGDEL